MSALNPLTPESVVRQNPDQVAAELDGEVLMMNVNTGNYYGLNEVASYVWNQLVQPMTVRALCDAIVGEFDVARETCQVDALSFLEDMLKDGLLLEVDPQLADTGTVA